MTSIALLTAINPKTLAPLALSSAFTYTSGVLTGYTEVILGITYTWALTYNIDGTPNIFTRTGGSITRTETYAYTSGVLTGFTATEV